MNNIARRFQLTPIHKLLLKLPSNYWTKYWNNKDELLQNYLSLIAAIRDKINKSKVTKVYLVSDDRAFFLAGFLATLQTSSTLVIPGMINSGLLQELIASDDCLLTTHRDLAATVPDTIMLQDIKLIADISLVFNEVALDKDIIFYTSGSTGKPQPVVKQLQYIEAEIAALEMLWGNNSSNSVHFFSTVPHHHIYGLLFSLLWPICSNHKIIRKTFTYWEELLFSYTTGDYIISSPSHLTRIPEVAKEANINCNHIFSSGAVLNFKDANTCKEVFQHLPIEVYGSTESGGIGYRQQATIEQPWQTFAGVKIKAAKDYSIIVASPYLSAEKPLIINDLIQLFTPNTFALIGRTDSIVKIEGKRVSLLEMQKRICSMSAIDDVVIIPIKHATRYELAALVVLTAAGKQELLQLGKNNYVKYIKQNIRGFFAEVVLPRRWRFIEQMPTNNYGKMSIELLEKYFLPTEDQILCC